MIPSFVFELLRFIVLFGTMALFCFTIFYMKEKKSNFPEYLLGERYDNYVYALTYFTRHTHQWLIIPLILYIILFSFGVLSDENFSRVVYVYEWNNSINYTTEIVIIPHKLNDGYVVSPFEKQDVIENTSNKRLWLKKHVYHRMFSKVTSYGEFDESKREILIKPHTTSYCYENNFPQYILEEAPSILQNDAKRMIIWSLEEEKTKSREE